MTVVSGGTSVLPAALAQAKQLGRMAERHSAAQGAKRTRLSRDIHERLDRLIDSLLTSYPDEEVGVSDVSAVLHQHHDLTPDALADLDQRIVPLVIIRELVSRNKLVVQPKNVPAWSRFVGRFQAVCRA